jgi:hypothetical protein
VTARRNGDGAIPLCPTPPRGGAVDDRVELAPRRWFRRARLREGCGLDLAGTSLGRLASTGDVGGPRRLLVGAHVPTPEAPSGWVSGPAGSAGRLGQRAVGGPRGGLVSERGLTCLCRIWQITV